MNAASLRSARGGTDPAVTWLRRSPDPSVRYRTLVDLLGEPEGSAVSRQARAQIIRGPKVRALLSGQEADGGFGVHPYKKWNGAHWRLVSLIELACPPDDPRLHAAIERVLGWLRDRRHLACVPQIRGVWRRCASQEGNALVVCSKLGMGRDPRVRELAADLLTWQWPDGGWNCDRRPQAHHASFHESLIPLWGLHEYHRATDDHSVDAAIARAAEFFLRHRLFRSERTGQPIRPRGVWAARRRGAAESEFLRLRYPSYWHYGILQALAVLARVGRVRDPRAQEALEILERKRRPDGTWEPEGFFWQRPGRQGATVEVVDWGRAGPNEMITLHALRVLKAAGRWEP